MHFALAPLLLLLSESPESTKAAAPPPTVAAESRDATALARAAHRDAAAIGRLPRLSYRVRRVSGPVAGMRDIAERTPARLKQALAGQVAEADRIVSEGTFAWDEERFLGASAYRFPDRGKGETSSRMHRFWTKSEAWERNGGDAGRAFYVLLPSPERIWEHYPLFEFGYFQVTPRRFWWGTTTEQHGGGTVPPEIVSYAGLGAEEFGGETCDLVEAPGRQERLWVGRGSGRLRGVLRYIYQGRFEPFHETKAVEEIAGRTFASRQEYADWHRQAPPERRALLGRAFNEAYFDSNANPGSLLLFDDYREVAPGVTVPFREVRVVALHADEEKGTFKYHRGETTVEEVRTDVELAAAIRDLLPVAGDRVQDQRFGVPVDYEYRPDQTEEQILELVAAKKAEYEEGRAAFERATAPLAALVGKPAPPLPAEGWIGGGPPDLTGQPYLLHFWATSCGPCKNDFPLLRRLAEGGARVVGVHPAGPPAAEVRKVVEDQKLGYPTLLASEEGPAGEAAGYPASVLPYCVVVDANGTVATHGSLGPELAAAFRAAREKADAKPREDVSP